jgi:hypothetical protein
LNLDVPGTGPVAVTVNELTELAQYGYTQLANKQKQEQEPKEPKEDTIESLREEINQLKHGKEQEKSLAGINAQLMQVSQSIDATREDPEFAQSVAAEALARYNLNPRLNLQNTFKAVAKQRLKKLEKMIEKRQEKELANKKVKSSMTTTMRGGGSPAIPAGKPRTAEDINSGASLRALREHLEAMGEMD